MSIYQSRCDTYDPDRLDRIMADHIDHHLGGIDLSGKKVLLKVNLLSGKAPEKAVTTHPAFLGSVIKALMAKGAICTIADSPGGKFDPDSLRKAYEIAGYDRIAEETGANLNYDVGSHDVTNPRGRLVKRFRICDFVNGHDLVIALPKVKTHTLMGLTCASKIMFGAIPGIEKVYYHTRFPYPDQFARMLMDLNETVRTDLFLVDGIVGMDGDGPSGGRPRELGLVLSGRDPLELDEHICHVVGLDPLTIPVNRLYRIERNGEGIVPLLEGPDPEYILDTPFSPAKGWGIARDPPRGAMRLIRPLTTSKPIIDMRKCTGCGVCANNCAGDAISIREGKARIDYSNCIRCYCCSELCPSDSISLREPPEIIGNIIEKVYALFGNERK